MHKFWLDLNAKKTVNQGLVSIGRFIELIAIQVCSVYPEFKEVRLCHLISLYDTIMV